MMCVNMCVHAMSMSTAESCFNHPTKIIKFEATFGVIKIYETVGTRRKDQPRNPPANEAMAHMRTRNLFPRGSTLKMRSSDTSGDRNGSTKGNNGRTVFPSDCITERFGRSCQEMLSQPAWSSVWTNLAALCSCHIWPRLHSAAVRSPQPSIRLG